MFRGHIFIGGQVNIITNDSDKRKLFPQINPKKGLAQKDSL